MEWRSRQVIVARRQRVEAEVLARTTHAAYYVQRMYRGKQVRDALRSISTAALAQGREAKMNRLRELQELQEAREHRRRTEKAARTLQRKGRVFFARQYMANLASERQREGASAALAISGSDSVGKLEALLIRHRIVKGVLYDVYSQVTSRRHRPAARRPPCMRALVLP